jgi:hypothetical protein
MTQKSDANLLAVQFVLPASCFLHLTSSFLYFEPGSLLNRIFCNLIVHRAPYSQRIAAF